MPRLKAPNGVVVSVSAETAKNLAARGGYEPVTDEKPRTAKKAASK
jgi:hypothetical protein